ncbi:hypothetical protein SNEBB_004269 [Seison nebaliae]|nr:hypothetical protein SNEBB_004269 [Seison nebaliae]
MEISTQPMQHQQSNLMVESNERMNEERLKEKLRESSDSTINQSEREILPREYSPQSSTYSMEIEHSMTNIPQTVNDLSLQQIPMIDKENIIGDIQKSGVKRKRPFSDIRSKISKITANDVSKKNVLCGRNSHSNPPIITRSWEEAGKVAWDVRNCLKNPSDVSSDDTDNQLTDETSSINEAKGGSIIIECPNICLLDSEDFWKNGAPPMEITRREKIAKELIQNGYEKKIWLPVIEVECHETKALLHKSKFGSGGRGKCIEVNNQLMTPNEFEEFAGRATSKDWKRSIRCGGKPLIKLIDCGVMTCHAVSCTCSACSNDSYSTEKIRYFIRVRRKVRVKPEVTIKNLDGNFIENFMANSQMSTPSPINNIPLSTPESHSFDNNSSMESGLSHSLLLNNMSSMNNTIKSEPELLNNNQDISNDNLYQSSNDERINSNLNRMKDPNNNSKLTNSQQCDPENIINAILKNNNNRRKDTTRYGKNIIIDESNGDIVNSSNVTENNDNRKIAEAVRNNLLNSSNILPNNNNNNSTKKFNFQNSTNDLEQFSRTFMTPNSQNVQNRIQPSPTSPSQNNPNLWNILLINLFQILNQQQQNHLNNTNDNFHTQQQQQSPNNDNDIKRIINFLQRNDNGNSWQNNRRQQQTENLKGKEIVENITTVRQQLQSSLTSLQTTIEYGVKMMTEMKQMYDQSQVIYDSVIEEFFPFDNNRNLFDIHFVTIASFKDKVIGQLQYQQLLEGTNWREKFMTIKRKGKKLVKYHGIEFNNDKRNGNGIKTVIVNMSAIAKALNCSPAYTTKFFGQELGAQTQIMPENDRWIINGVHDANRLQEVLDVFIRAYVLCKFCKNPETQLIVSTKTIRQKCAACGEIGPVDMKHRIAKYICNQAPKVPKKSKVDNKSTVEVKKSDVEKKVGKETKKTTKKTEVKWISDISKEAQQQRLNENLSGMAQRLTIDTSHANASEQQRLEIFDKELRSKCSKKNSDGYYDYLLETNTVKDIANRIDDLSVEEKSPYVFVEIMFSDNIKEELMKYSTLLKSLCAEQKTQRNLLLCLEKIIYDNEEKLMNRVEVSMILKSLYDEDIVDDDVFIEWQKKPRKKTVSKEISKKIHDLANDFVNWLEESDSEDDEESEEEKIEEKEETNGEVPEKKHTKFSEEKSNGDVVNETNDVDDKIYKIPQSNLLGNHEMTNGNSNEEEDDDDDFNIDDI